LAHLPGFPANVTLALGIYNPDYCLFDHLALGNESAVIIHPIRPIDPINREMDDRHNPDQFSRISGLGKTGRSGPE